MKLKSPYLVKPHSTVPITRLPPAETGFVDVRIQKLGTDYPALHGVATVQSQPSHHPSIP